MDVDVEHPHVHHHRSGHHWLDFALPIAALFVSFVSIYIAWHHGKVMQELVDQNARLVQANSIPHLQLYGSNASDSGARGVSLNVSNEGVGPAEIRSVQLLVDDRPVGSLSELLRACCGGNDYSGLATSTLLGRMIRPGTTIAYVNMPPGRSQAATDALDRARVQDRIEARLCYCSVFDECWTVSSKGSARPVPVRQCPMPQPQYRE